MMNKEKYPILEFDINREAKLEPMKGVYFDRRLNSTVNDT